MRVFVVEYFCKVPRKEVFDMNVSGVSPSAAVSALDMSANADMIANVSMAASVKVLDMAQNVFENVADQLLQEMAALMTGIGQNIDVYA